MLKVLIAACLCLLAMFASAAERHIDTANSSITIHVGKAGLFSAAGHEHEVTAPLEDGAIDGSRPGRAWFVVKASRLTVRPEPDQAEVQSTMQSSVLESNKYPDIKFESTSVRPAGENRWMVTGNLTLHGRTNPVTTEVHKTESAYTGEARIKQTDFGITPIKVAGGTVKVKDELKIEFVIKEK